MWPWGHLAFGYLLYAGYRWGAARQAPRDWPVVALAIGTQFPDLVDKPLAYWFGVLPGGRSLAHSVLVFLPIAVILLVLAWNYRRTEIGVAFAIGWGSHLVGDSMHALRLGTYGQLSFLLWPALPAPDYETMSFIVHARLLVSELRRLDGTTLLAPGEDPFVLGLWLAGLVFLLWVGQGMPPLGSMRRWLAAGAGIRRALR